MPSSENAPEPWDVIVREHLTGDVLVVKGKRIAHITEALWEYEFLTHLDLSDNLISVLPSGASLLRNLTELHLDNNKLEELPPSLGTMHWLQVLSLAGNRLTGFLEDSPRENLDMRCLTYLDLNSNKLATIPLTLKYLTSLSVLRIG